MHTNKLITINSPIFFNKYTCMYVYTYIINIHNR